MVVLKNLFRLLLYSRCRSDVDEILLELILEVPVMWVDLKVTVVVFQFLLLLEVEEVVRMKERWDKSSPS